MTASKPITRPERDHTRHKKTERHDNSTRKTIQQSARRISPLPTNIINPQLQGQGDRKVGESTLEASVTLPPSKSYTPTAHSADTGNRDDNPPVRLTTDPVRYQAQVDDEREEGECTPVYLDPESSAYLDFANYQTEPRQEPRQETDHRIHERSEHMAAKRGLGGPIYEYPEPYSEADGCINDEWSAIAFHHSSRGSPKDSSSVRACQGDNESVSRFGHGRRRAASSKASYRDDFRSPPSRRQIGFPGLPYDETESVAYSRPSSKPIRRYRQRFTGGFVNRRRTLEAYTTLASGRSMAARMRESDFRSNSKDLKIGTIISTPHHTQGREDFVDPNNPNQAWSPFGPVHSKYRKMVVVEGWGEHYNCLPIYTYNGRGLDSYGVDYLHREDIFDEYIGIQEGEEDEPQTNTEPQDEYRYRSLTAYRHQRWKEPRNFISDAALIKLTEQHNHNAGDRCSIEGRIKPDDMLRLLDILEGIAITKKRQAFAELTAKSGTGPAK
ncbi:hypothetical protein AK830_g3670 [Neonectria ditissima]|uniref:DUF6590 domain-containing protein n=1 Tax=Neonectria ditissima TaxID=78410 RepID=A0A0P7BPP4_9HYPO|nr:hypothetical protein AK830_g3670 [Neonectria ditissima]